LDKDFYERQFLKLAQILHLAKKVKASAFLHGGDFFDSYEPTLRLLHNMISTLKGVDIPWLINPGNHDVFGANMESLRRSGLGILAEAGRAITFPKQQDVTFDGERVIVRFIPYTIVMNPEAYVFEDKHPSKVYILVPHEMITTHFVPFPHTLYTDVKTNADVVLCSHWHSQFNLTRKDGIRFVNSGPLTRQTTHEAKLKPAVVVLEVTPEDEIVKKSINVELFHLVVPEAKDVIDLTVDSPAAMEGIAEQFMSVLRDGALEGVDRQKLVRLVGEKHGFTTLVIENGLVRVQAAERVMESV
jgi:DNA repair exonuclease SbcCD nuclease subunit